MGDLITITTWPKHPYVFYRFTSRTLLVQIKASANAAIGLARKPGKTCDFWVVIGEHNRRSWIKKEDNYIKHANTPNIITNNQYRAFWVTWFGDSVQFGQEGDVQPIIAYAATMPEIEYVTFAVIGERNPVHWKFEVSPPRGISSLKAVTGGTIQWIATDSQLPDGAFIGGYEKENLYIIRALHRGSLTPGKFVPSEGVGYISWGGDAVEKNQFEVLCGYNVVWLRSSNGEVPPGALVGGYSEVGHERLFIGRAVHNGNIIPGKVQPSHRCCYISYNEKEVAKRQYEILVNPNVHGGCIATALSGSADNDSEDGSQHEDVDEDNRSDYSAEHFVF